MSLFLCRRPGAWCLALSIGVLAQPAVFAQPAEPPVEDRSADPLPPAAPAPSGYFLLPLPGGQPVFERLGIQPEERGHALMLIARALHGAAVINPTGSLAIAFTEVFGPITLPSAGVPSAETTDPNAVVLAPFDDRLWRQLLTLTPDADLFTQLVKHRGALLVAAGALEAGPAVREWLADNPRLLRQIVRELPGSFTQAAPALVLGDDGWAVPGDRAAWTALVGVPPARREDFLRRLLSRDEGRLARFFANLALMPSDRRAALLQPEHEESAEAALGSLYSSAREAEAPWSPNDHPYQLSYADLPAILHSLSDLPIDRLPATAGLWPSLIESEVETRERATQLLQAERAAAPFTATVRALLKGGPRERRDRVTMLALARRVWDGDLPARDQADVLYALGHYRRFRAMLLMLDRIEVRAPHVWGRLVDAARRIDGGSGIDRALRLQAFQGALALVERTALTGSLAPERRDEVLAALAEAVDSETATHTAVRAWLLDHFIPALPPLVQPDRFTGATAYESRVIQALAGPPPTEPRPVKWEGLDYVVDIGAAEHERILRIRGEVPSPGLDAALEKRDAASLPAALRALIYAVALGDPDGAVTLSPDVAERHDLLGMRAAGREFAWMPAAERTGSSMPWHIAGSLLGVDLAMARSALRRLSADEMPPVPTINLNDEMTLARTAVALRPLDLDDAGQSAIAAAIARGRARLAAAAADPRSVLALADEVAVPIAVRRAIGWTLASIPEAAGSFFSLRDLLWLGHPDLPAEKLARWGVIGDAVDGRLVPRLGAPSAWDRLAGRPDTGILATEAPDLTLHLVELTSALHVPASLIPALLLYATQDYWHEVEARFPDDWPALVRGALALPPSRVEDYIAALGSGGPLRPR